MDAVGVEDSRGVVYHLPLKIMYLFPYDAYGRANLAGIERITLVDILDTCLDDVPFHLRHIDILLIHPRGSRHTSRSRSAVANLLAFTCGSMAQRVGVFYFHPFYIVVPALVERIHDGDKLMGHLGAAPSVCRQHIISAMEVGRQFDDAGPLSVFKTHSDTGKRTLVPPRIEMQFTTSNVLKKRLNQP